MPDTHNEGGRTVHERVGALEQEAAVTRHRLNAFDREHGQSPNRLTKLEQQFEHQSRQLTAIGDSQEEMASKMDKMGDKISYGLGAAAIILALFDKVWPYIAKGFGA
ncbi:MAG TPA: hypothetical protein DHV63_13110 [Pseudomonas sp.]|nr:hypothetical protein [Pseudomonas sp.]